MERELLVGNDVSSVALELWREINPKTVALSGGSTPREFYRRLAGNSAQLGLDGVEYFFGDERCVPPDHPDSNFRMARESLLDHLSDAVVVHRMPAESCDASEYESEIAGVRFDLILLGLGTDGHTCSLFPGDPALDITDHLVARVDRPDHRRLTLTFPAIDTARVGVFLVAGESKGAALAGLIGGNDELPAARVACERIVIVADRDAVAASGVKG